MSRRTTTTTTAVVATPPSVTEHTRSTLALSGSVFTVAYLLISVFPYAGFMAIQLLPEKLNEENAGLYAGLLASAFMVGRALSSYAWGQAADRYGRVTCLTLSLTLSSGLSLAFGLSTSFKMALVWRFGLGVVNGVLPIAKTAVSELAGDNRQLETRGMGLVMGMWGWGFLVSPAISGAVAEPLKQYPHLRWLQDENQWYYAVLQKFPFLLPNLVGALMGLLAAMAVSLFVTETLPKEIARSLHQIPGSLWHSIKRALSVIPEEDLGSEEFTPMARHTSEQKAYGSSAAAAKPDYDSDEENMQTLEALYEIMGDDVEEAVRESQHSYDESVLLLSTTRHPEQAITEAVQRRSSVSAQQRRASLLSAAGGTSSASFRSWPSSSAASATMASLWAQRSTRNHMILYWASSFVTVAVDEGFPLFCISKAAGLGLSEKSIGKILSASGLVFGIAQYGVYAVLVHWFGLYGSIRIGSILMGPTVALIPLTLWLNRTNDAPDHVTLTAFVFLSVLMGALRVFGMVFASSLTVALNRTVLPSHRGTMNGFSSLGGSVARAIGPTFAGALVAFSFSSGVWAPHVGAFFMFGVLGGLGALVSILSYVLIDDDEANMELKV